jgi:ABC-type transport system involved in cytochrome c biogenesis permease component
MSAQESRIETPDVAAPTVERVGIFERIGDRLNPILIREVNQALRGRAFLATGILALMAIVIIALTVAAQGEEATGSGGTVLAGTLGALIPLLMFIVPLQAFVSTRHEVTRGTSEHLHLSRLGPGAIIRGKIAASMVQLLLYLSIFAPLLAMTFLLRGVDVPTIALALLLCLIFGLGACALAVACGALCRWPSIFRVLPVVAVVVGLGSLTIFLVADLGSFYFLWNFGGTSGKVWQIALGVSIPVVLGVVLCGMVGAAVLAHPYENRSTAFRIFALVSLILGLGWMLLVVWITDAPVASILHEAIPGYVATCAGLLALFPIFAATEEPTLSPRVRSRVSRRAGLAFHSVPFLPGRGNGVLFGTLLATVALGSMLVMSPFAGSQGLDADMVGIAILCWLYVLVYAGIAGFARAFLPDDRRGNWIARAVVPALLLLAVLLPLLFGLFGDRRFGRGWEPYDILNPFATIARYDGGSNSPYAILPYLACIWAITLLLNLRAVGRAVAEVMDASRERRRCAR